MCAAKSAYETLFFCVDYIFHWENAVWSWISTYNTLPLTSCTEIGRSTVWPMVPLLQCIVVEKGVAVPGHPHKGTKLFPSKIDLCSYFFPGRAWEYMNIWLLMFWKQNYIISQTNWLMCWSWTLNINHDNRKQTFSYVEGGI